MIRKSGRRFPGKVMLHQHRRAPDDSIQGDDGPPAAGDRQRIDKWLWHARLVRTRGAAAALAGAGYVRVNGAALSETRAISTELPPEDWVFREISSGVLTAVWSEDSEQEEAGELVGTGLLRTSRIHTDGVEASRQLLEQTTKRCPNTVSQCATGMFALQLNELDNMR